MQPGDDAVQSIRGVVDKARSVERAGSAHGILRHKDRNLARTLRDNFAEGMRGDTPSLPKRAQQLIFIDFVVPGGGLEPPRPDKGLRILSPLCLPISPSGL